jgi:glycosyltransferase involved in cell wall biosynthesis
LTPARVTVLLLTYNHRDFIAQSIESVLKQRTGFSWELTIFDDCSTDGTREIVQHYAAENPDRVTAVLAEANGQSSAAWLSAFASTSSQYVAILEGDDYWTSAEKLQKQVDFLDAHPACSMAFHNVRVIHEGTRIEPYEFNPAHQKRMTGVEDLLDANYIATCSAMYRAGVVREFPDQLMNLVASDWAFHLLHAEHGVIGYLPDTLGAYRVREAGSWTGLNHERKLENALVTYDAFDTSLSNRYSKRIAKARNRSVYGLYLVRMTAGERESADALVREALRHAFDLRLWCCVHARPVERWLFRNLWRVSGLLSGRARVRNRPLHRIRRYIASRQWRAAMKSLRTSE